MTPLWNSDAKGSHVPLSHGLSLKLLLLTILFVLLAEVLIFLPSIANFRMRWLEERLNTTAAVGIVLVERDTPGLPRDARTDLLSVLGAKAIAVRDAGASRLLIAADIPTRVDEHVDLANTSALEAMTGAVDSLLWGGKRMLRIFGPVGESTKEFELIISDGNLRAAMLVYSRNIAALSTVISIVTALLVFAAVNRIMIKPIRVMTRSMLNFAETPEDASCIVEPSGRTDEIGVAQRELASMQSRLRNTFAEQRHLVDLGLAVSKINHDMRNILASAQLLLDRLGAVRDPVAQSLAPKLLKALDRAVSYSEGVLAYGRTQEPVPVRRRLRLHLLVDEVLGFSKLDRTEGTSGVELVNAVPADFELDADPEQLFRVLSNLCRNAIQAMIGSEQSVVRRLTVSAEKVDLNTRVLVADTGPGLPLKARENLFAAFRGSARSGGTGLGLAIASELARAHGGELELVESTGSRTTFAVVIPD